MKSKINEALKTYKRLEDLHVALALERETERARDPERSNLTIVTLQAEPGF